MMYIAGRRFIKGAYFFCLSGKSCFEYRGQNEFAYSRK